ncbi:hypothetical protein COLO4_28826 [Corchorus olitorius]|uniref:Uncharacterized protein n=1 Tax=Corchorus olitorius TaxID=93759 RepID=A0A1R3HI82_9ROSI|nr:hypothetical protein COLO4_28826 [Corchorus olitorius]
MQMQHYFILDANDSKILCKRPKKEESPDHCHSSLSSLIALYLQENQELIATIPPWFFQRILLVQVLDLSGTNIKSLPKSLPKMGALRKLLIRGCQLFMELSPQVGQLEKLEQLDLDETQIMGLPIKMGKLLCLRDLRLTDLSIEVDPADKRWDDSVEVVVKEVCNLKSLRSLSLYLPKFQLLEYMSYIYPSLSRFRFTVGYIKRRVISRVPQEVEAQFRNWDKSFKFVNGENIPIEIEIKGVLRYSNSFFLDRHATAKNLSEFGIENMQRLKFCLLAECDQMRTIIDERNEEDISIENVVESLEYLSIYYMEKLETIWRGASDRQGGIGILKLKFLALHTCPQLSIVFSYSLLGNLVNLEELVLEDCPLVTTLEKIKEIDDVELQNNYSEFEEDESDNSRKKRARKSALAVAADEAGATVAADLDNVCPSKPGSGSGKHRRLWVKDRCKGWWEERNRPDFPDEEFKRDFRMSKAIFNMICEELEPVVMKKNCNAIPVRLRVAVCIWRLATGEPLRMVSKQFGLGISTCHKQVLEVCTAIKGVLMPKFLKWPDDNNMKRIEQEFESMTGIPNVGGSMYTTHIPVIAPKVSVAAYFNKKHTEKMQKNCYSITLQGVVDERGDFTEVCIGWPGSMSDDQVLEKSALYHRATTRGLFKDVPYAHHNLTWAQHGFSEKIGKIEKVAKDAFARLKGRWSCLQKRTEIKLQDLPFVLGACCILDNICELRNEDMDPMLEFELFDDETIPENNLRSMASVQARDHIARNLLHRPFL